MNVVNVETRPPSILLIDGHASEAALMEAQFRRVDVPAMLHFVRDGEEAIEFLFHKNPHEKAPRPALILLDMKLANGGGFEMLTLAKSDESLARIPVIVMATAADSDVEKAYLLRANCCVRRPEGPEDLVQFVGFLRTFWLELMILPTGADT
jgi:CheY-like chemotaxis protein